TWSGLGSTNQEIVNSGTKPQDHSGGAILDSVLNSSRGRTLGKSLRASVLLLDNMSKDYSEVTVEVNGIHEGSNINGGEKSRQRKKHIFCCFRSAADQ
ncbi:hypothetical protein MKW92_032404, partial [Papaver armeniacum]